MADGSNGADGVRKTGLGFFNKTGELKSKEQLGTEQAGTSKAEAAAADSTEFTTKVSESFGAVGREFRSDANQAITAVNQADDDLKQASKIVREERKTARELKRAIKDGDEKGAEKLREKLGDIRDTREQIAKSVGENNKERAVDKNQVVTFGNEVVAAVKINEVEFTGPTEAELKTAKGVDAYIDSLAADSKALVAQRQELRETRQELKAVVEDVEGKLSKLRDNAIGSYEEAASLADSLSSRIKSNSQEALAVNVSENVVKALFQ